MNYLFDTNILVYIIKGHSILAGLESEISSDTNNLRIISIVSKGEIESIALQFKWGEKRSQQLETLLNLFLIVPVDSNQIVKAYSEIDAFSQGKHPTMRLQDSSRNMGKNDLWIAATASVTNSILVTADSDFDHLDKIISIKKLNV